MSNQTPRKPGEDPVKKPVEEPVESPGDKPVVDGQTLHRHLMKVWDNWPGWGTLAAVNHTSIGLRFLITGLVFFIIGGVLAMLIRTQLALPEQSIVDVRTYNQLFTMHGTIMMFLFAIPALEGLAVYLIPKMIGARDLVFPRLSSFGYYCYLFGGMIVLAGLFLGIAPDSGWFMYTPLSSQEYAPGPGSDFWLLGITFVEISAVAAGVELTVSILRSRAPGMTLGRMPLFCWYILGMALMIVFGFPPLILASIMLELERAAGLPFFIPEAGGDPLLWQHLFWLFGHPEVYIIFLPAAGIVSTLIPVFCGRPMIGYRWLVLSVILTAFTSFALWVHHMFTVGIPHVAQAFFSIASMLIAIPTGVQVFAWLATIWVGRVRFELPMLWVFGFLVIFVCGGLTGVMIALVPFNWQVHDTHFIVAHFHYVLVGGMYFPMIAGLYYWLPHMTGKMPSQRTGRWAFWLTFIGFNTTFLLMHLTGLLGMPRRIYTYEAGVGWDWLNLLSSLGGFIMAVGVALTFLDLLLHWRFGRDATQNPWQADTLEWATPIPPPPYNFASIPTIRSRHPMWDDPKLPEFLAAGQGELVDLRHERRDTLGTEAIRARPEAIYHVPSNNWQPMLAALALSVVCISLLVRAYPLALLAVVVAAFFLLRWSWENGAQPWMAPVGEPAGPWPLHSRTADGPGRWGMIFTMMANGSLYLSLLFGWLYLVVVTPARAAMASLTPVVGWLLTSGALLLVATLWYGHLVRQVLRGQDRGLAARCYVAAALAALHCLFLLITMVRAPLDLAGSAYDSVVWLALAYSLFHGGLVVVLTLVQATRVQLGYVNAALPYEPTVLRPLWLYTLVVFLSTIVLVLVVPAGWGAA